MFIIYIIDHPLFSTEGLGLNTSEKPKEMENIKLHVAEVGTHNKYTLHSETII